MKPIYIISFIALLATSVSGFLYYKYSQTQSQLAKVTESKIDQTPKIIDQVGQHLLLPTDETPTVATITDKDKLSGQPFFTQAENGDQILIYVQSKKAVLYRPSLNKIIDITTINSSTPEAKLK